MMPDEITIKVKTTKEAHDVKALPDANISELKSSLSDLVSAPVQQLCLIFSGKILKDHEKLNDLGLTDGMALHLVIRAAPKAEGSTSTAAATSAANSSGSGSADPPIRAPNQPTTLPAPAAANPAPGNNPFAGLMAGAGGAGLDMNAAQQQMMQNPELMQQMMDSPMMQSLMSNPEMMQNLIMSNPRMRGLIESNPEFGHMLNNPELMRQSMEMMRNPNMFNEMMRSHDRAVSNLEGIPGGMAALQRLYQEVQEPLMDGVAGQAGNPFAALRNGNQDQSSTSANQGVENTEALPNPWGTRPTNNANTTANNTNTNAQPGGANGLAGLFGADGAGAGALGGMDMGAMMNNPMMQQMMQQLTQNPEQLAQMMGPMMPGGNTPQAQAQLRQMMPQIMQQMNNPSVMSAMANPRVQTAMQQIQQGMQVLQTEAPQLLPMLGMQPGGGAMGAVPGQGAAPAAGGNAQANALAQMMQQMGALNGGGQAADPRPATERYEQQLEQLANMGFVNQEANIRALTAAFGDLNGAVERLLGGPQ